MQVEVLIRVRAFIAIGIRPEWHPVHCDGHGKVSLGHPLVVPFLWATVSWLPFHFLLGIIFRSRLPQIERQLGDIILERPKNENV